MHIAEVAAGIVAEIKPGAGPVVVVPRGEPPTEYDRARQH